MPRGHAGGQRESPACRPDRDRSPAQAEKNREEAQAVAERVVPDLGGNWQKREDRHSQAGDSFVEERPRDAVQREQERQRRDGRHELRGNSPAVWPRAREGARPLAATAAISAG